MKTRIIITVILVLFTAAFMLNTGNKVNKTVSPPVPVNNNISDDFLIGTLNDADGSHFDYLTDSLSFNLWHRYCDNKETGGKWYPAGWIHNGAPGDTLFADSSVYISQVQGVLSNIEGHHMKALMHRPKIEYLCYGQRSDYQCEPAPIDTGMWFYSFNDHETGIPETDSGQAVIHCRAGDGPNHDSPGFVVKRLKTNTEQSHVEGSNDAYRLDGQCDWLIKPRIRIDSGYANNPANWNNKVFRVIILNQFSDTVKDLDVTVTNFLDGTLYYDGRYLEEYSFAPNDSNLITYGAWGDKWIYEARGTCVSDPPSLNNHADIQVWWYGNCDMWIDYVRVDNDVASDLLTDNHNNPNWILFNQWLQWEAQDIANHGNAPLEFYIELLEFNQIPCISYVNEKLREYSGRQINVMAEPLWGFEFHMPRSAAGEIVTPEKISSLYFDRTGSREIFVGDPYSLNAASPSGCPHSHEQFSKLPSTLPRTGGDSVLADTISPSVYDAWLENRFDTACTFYETTGYPPRDYDNAGAYLFLLKRGDAVSRLRNIPLIVMVQSHQWVSPGEIDREPTNEELNMMVNLAVSYGARGIIYWGWSSFYDNGCKYSCGIVKRDYTPRLENVYGQPKWENIKNTDNLLNTWGPTLMSFNNADRRSYIYRLERDECLYDTYFYDIITYKPGTLPEPCADNNPLPGQNPPSGLVFECYEDRYLQVATFKQTSGDDGYPHFMIVNRRCSPVKSGYPDGRRDVRVIFDASHADLYGFDNWKIINVYDNSFVDSFNKTILKLVDLGEFEPGEGKLYRLEPISKTGGILVGNEDIQSGSFTCEGTVYTNGYDLTIEDGVTIHFRPRRVSSVKDSAHHSSM